MEKEDLENKKYVSRKWLITIWALVVGTLIVLFSGICTITGYNYPDGFCGLATLLFSTGIAYIGGNVWQKQIQSKETEDK